MAAGLAAAGAGAGAGLGLGEGEGLGAGAGLGAEVDFDAPPPQATKAAEQAAIKVNRVCDNVLDTDITTPKN